MAQAAKSEMAEYSIQLGQIAVLHVLMADEANIISIAVETGTFNFSLFTLQHQRTRTNIDHRKHEHIFG